jgi:hypothetical protein
VPESSGMKSQREGIPHDPSLAMMRKGRNGC